MSIHLTSAATERVRHFLANEGGLGLRLGVRKTGCSGWAYVVELADQIKADERLADMVLVRLASFPTAKNAAIDPTSLPAYQAVAEYLLARD